MKYRYTKHQVARGSRPDAEDGKRLYLVKGVSFLHATYQVRLLAFVAQKEGKKLVIKVPSGFRPAPSLKALMRETGSLIRVEEA